MWKIDSVSGSVPLSVAQAKTHLRVDHSDEDSLISSFITAAQNMVELYTGRKLQRSVVVENVPYFEASIPLRWPIVSLTSVEYLPSGTDGSSYSSTSIYKIYESDDNRFIYQKADTTYPSVLGEKLPIKITYSTGYADGEVPDALLQAMYLFIGRMYENGADARELQQVSTNIPTTAEYMMNPYRLNFYK